MADSSSHPVFVPKINSEDHGAKIVICGALILPPITMMVALSVYNRVRAKTLFQVDGLVTLLGTVCSPPASPTDLVLIHVLPDLSHRNICDICSC
jgi:hypothetical protein